MGLRRIVRLIESIFWDSCVEELKVDTSAEILTLRPASYLKNRNQRKLFQEYIDLHSDEIFFGALTKEIVPSLDESYWPINYPDISKVFKDEDIVCLSEKVKVKNKIIQIPSTKWAKKSDPNPRKMTASCLLLNNHIILFRAGKYYVTKTLSNDRLNTMKNIICIHEKVRAAHQRMKSRINFCEGKAQYNLSEKPGVWLLNYFKNLDFHWWRGTFDNVETDRSLIVADYDFFNWELGTHVAPTVLF